MRDEAGAWKLPAMLRAMGARYDFSELPTVCYVEGKPVVWDGNRRVAIGMLKHGIVDVPEGLSGLPGLDDIEFPDVIPCNVCSQDVAVDHVLRKHRAVGSWKPLYRDIFVEDYKGETSDFLKFEKASGGLISKHPAMNQGFVKSELLTKPKLGQIGLKFKADGTLETNFAADELRQVLQRIVTVVEDESLSTRSNRRELYQLLVQDPAVREIFQRHGLRRPPPRRGGGVDRYPIFGGPLEIADEVVGRQLIATERMYNKAKTEIKRGDEEYTAIVRAGMRLLVELAAERRYGRGSRADIGRLVNEYYAEAKRKLDPRERELVRDTGVGGAQGLIRQLNSGAHANIATGSRAKLLGISAIVGRILELAFPVE